MNKKVKAKLIEIGRLLELSPTTGVQARDSDGFAVPYDADTAVKWSLEGAILKTCPSVNKPHVTAYAVAREIFRMFPFTGNEKPYRWDPPESFSSEPSESFCAWDAIALLWDGLGTTNETRL